MNSIKTNYLRGLNLEGEGPIPSVSGVINSGCHLYIGDSEQDSVLKLKNISGDVITFKNLQPGTILQFSCNEILEANQVKDIVALW